jgi:hypothetical protein
LQTDGLLRRPLESRPEAPRHGDQAGLEGELEDAPDKLAGLAEPVGLPLLRQGVAQPGEVVRVDVRQQASLTECPHNGIAGFLVIRPRPRRQVANIDQGLLLVQESVHQVVNRVVLGRLPGLAAGVQGFRLLVVLL